MIYDVKPGAKLQRNPQISKSFMPKYPRISKSFVFRTKNKYFPQGLVEVAEQVETHQNKSILGYFQKHALAVALYLVKTYNAVEFGIVGLGVGVDFVCRFPSVIEETLQIIKHHISFEHMVVLDISVF